jgi:hypothetical protein
MLEQGEKIGLRCVQQLPDVRAHPKLGGNYSGVQFQVSSEM